MAQFDTAFDASSVDPATAYEVLPAGRYQVQIVESDLRVTKDGTGQYLWLMMDILEGADQRAACARHLFIPDLVPGEVVAADRDYVTYSLADGTTWTNDARDGEEASC